MNPRRPLSLSKGSLSLSKGSLSLSKGPSGLSKAASASTGPTGDGLSPGQWVRLFAAELPLLRDLPDFAERPLPRVGVTLGPSVPGWVLRAAAALAIGGLLTVATQRTAVYPGFGWTIVGVATAVMVIWPTTVVAQAAVVAAGFLIALDGHGPFDPVVFALIPLAYVAVRLAWWAERVALAARVELAALLPGLGRGCALVGGTLALGALAFVLVGQSSAIAVMAGGVGLAALGGFLLVARRT